MCMAHCISSLPPIREMALPVLNVNAETHFAYLDSGAPNTHAYKTIFVVHGIAFNAKVFQKVIDLAQASSVRIVAMNRSDYPGSSTLSEKELTLLSGSEADCVLYLSNRGADVLAFVDGFIQENRLPAISEDGQTGGVAILGWSLGSSFAIAALASALKADSAVQSRLAKYIRALILEDPASVALGVPMPELNWAPGLDESIPPKERLPFNIAWLSSYFDHGDLSKRDPKALTYASPSIARVPSIYSMYPQYSEIVDVAPLMGSDGLHMAKLGGPSRHIYEQVFFGKDIRALLPRLKVWVMGREQSGWFGITTFWQVQDDNAKYGGDVNLEMFPKTNHFVHWDAPELAIASWKKALAS
ncbi:hypothetical protein DFP72DRAFT_889486 [Ephemerocybe angulata]|uniref:AB hydrolase-1 domain-containing protein n=1 Tax=Ephemerocybe angulata TaxID=980116 RepID=A0A8H6MBD3_9AGAR|nr:hypothetical protein DFP72DRAFT_889486 [Tulosesus angulatus]